MKSKAKPFSKCTRSLNNEGGFILVLTLAALVTLSVIGVWAMNNSSLENLIAGNHQRYEEEFQVSEGAISAEGGELGFSRTDWYKLPDSSEAAWGSLLVPDNDNDFDPGNDDVDVNNDGEGDAFTAHNAAATTDADRYANSMLWPYQNLTRDVVDNERDYRYLVTYLEASTAGKGEGEDMYAYKFRVNANRTLNVEIGGSVVASSGGLDFEGKR